MQMETIIFTIFGSILTGFAVYFATKKTASNKLSNYKDLDEALQEHSKLLDTTKTEVDDTSKRLLELKAEVDSTDKKLLELKTETKKLVELQNKANELTATVRTRTEQIEKMQDTYDELQQLKRELDLYTRIEDFVEYGLFEEPEYLYETSDRFAVEIRKVRDRQKDYIKNKLAIEIPNDDISIDGSSKTAKAVIDGQAKMMLQSFNIECDYLIGKVNISNFDRTLDQIEKNAERLEKLSVSLLIGFNTDYVRLKYEECKLQYQFKLKQNEEQEEQKAIKEQMREEEKARREFEKALRDAEKEERMYSDLLEKAKKEIETAKDDERALLNAKIEMLQQQLIEAQEKESRAKSMAEQTKRGHVYVISNIGSFGENVYKIGLTRRLDPLDRVKELGDASVPFQFDVHAMIYSENAPAMEATLHREFDKNRLNAVNRKKEFFNISLAEIKNRVEKITGKDSNFKMTALAEEYYETLRLLGN
jgi:DNA repair exonuclease SbcCD ATPase subunit